MLLANWLNGVRWRLFLESRRSRRSSGGRVRKRRRSGLPTVAAYVDLLEERVLLSALPLGVETLVNVTTHGHQRLSEPTDRSLDVTADGSTVVVWTSTKQTGETQSGESVIARRIDAQGHALGGEIVIASGKPVDHPVVAWAGEDRFLVVWEATGSSLDRSGSGILGRMFSSSGTPLGGEFLINKSTSGSQKDPSLAWVSSTEFVVAWTDSGAGKSSIICARKFDISGTPLTNEIRVPAYSKAGQQEPVVGALPGGGFIVAWSGDGTGDSSGIFTRRFDAAGNPVGGDILVNSSASGNQSRPTIAVSPEQGVIVAWQATGTKVDKNGPGVFARRLSLDGTPLGAEFLVNDYTTGDQKDPSVEWLNDGGFVVTWSGNGPDDSSGVHVREFDANGTPRGLSRRVNNTTHGSQASPAVSAFQNGYLIDWSGQGVGDNHGVFIQRFGELNQPPPVVTVRLLNDTGISTTDRLTNNSTVAGTATGTNPVAVLEAALTVGDASPTFVNITPKLAGGTFTLTSADLAALLSSQSATLPDGSYTLTVRARDTAGKLSNLAVLTFTLDTTPPALTLSLAPESDTDEPGDQTTSLHEVTLVGATEPGLVVVLGPSGAQATADGTGAFRFDNVLLVTGQNPFGVSATDAAGNTGTFSTTFTFVECDFGDLTGWEIGQTGGSESGLGSVAVEDCSVTLREGDSFNVTFSRTFIVDAAHPTIRFTYENPDFDLADASFINDAFEVALLDADGNPLVPTFTPGRDAFLNISEGLPAALGAWALTVGQSVTLDLTDVPVGTVATLVFRLVNNDNDHETTVRILDADVPPAIDREPSGPPVPLQSAFASPDVVADLAAAPLSTLPNGTSRISVGNVFVPPGATDPVPFTAEIEWTKSSFSFRPDSNQVMMAPAVADLDADGFPDIVFNTFSRSGISGGSSETTGVLRAIRGVDGAELWSVVSPYSDIEAFGGVAVADIDGDGRVEVIAHTIDHRVVAFESDGTFKWISTATVAGGAYWGSASIADLDHDGRPEIVFGATVLNSDGTLRWSGTGGHGGIGGSSPLSAVADVDLDGSPDIVAGNTTYRADGSVLWNASVPDGYPAIGNFDSDAYPEIVVVSSGNVYLLDHDGHTIWGPVGIPGGGNGGPPTIADFDGDGLPEIGVAGASQYVVLDSDGQIKWMAATVDSGSNVTGSSVFDFDGDGRAEVVYGDEHNFWIFSGANGAVLTQIAKGSGTTFELPVVVDVDGDGHAEIVVAANDYVIGNRTGIMVIGDDDHWVGTGQIWNQHQFHITNVNPDGTIPTHEANSWEIYNNYRRNIQPTGTQIGAPLLSVSAPDSTLPAGSTVLLSGVATAQGQRGDGSLNTIVLVTVNGAPVDAVDPLGNFFALATIQPGENRFTFRATDAVGQSVEGTLVLFGTSTAVIDASQTIDVSASFAVDYARTSFDDADRVLYADTVIRNLGQYPANVPLLVGVTNISDPSVIPLNTAGTFPDGTPYYDFSTLVSDDALNPGESTGPLSLAFFNPGRDQFRYDLVFYGLPNRAPAFTTVPLLEAPIGRTYQYDANATDPDSDPLTFRLVTGPAGMTVNAQTGELTWTPSEADLGTHTISIEVTDGRGGVAEQRFILSAIVAPPNRPPVITSAPVQHGNVGVPYSYDVNATDPDFDPVRYTLIDGPQGMTIDPVTGQLSWLPSAADLENQPPSSTELGNAPGYRIDAYAEGLQAPVQISIDSLGNLYVGADLHPGKPYMVSREGRIVSELGTEPQPDPDSVLFDETGIISGVPGTLIAGSYIGSGVGVIVGIRPDGQAVPIAGPSPDITNPESMQRDSSGRLIFNRWRPGFGIAAVQNGQVVPLFNPATETLGIVLDAQDRLYVLGTDGVIRIYTLNGTLLDPAFATGLRFESWIALGPGGIWGDDLYVAEHQADNTTTLWRIGADKQRHIVGEDLPYITGIAFGPDGAMYLSDYENGRILRMSPDRATLGLANGEFPVTVAAADGRGGIATQTFVICVEPAPENHDPVIVSTPVTNVSVHNLVTNGSFESGNFNNSDTDPRPEIMLVTPGMTNIPGWFVTGSLGVHWMFDIRGTSTDGKYGVDLQGANPPGQLSSFSTTFETTTGKDYLLSFEAYTGNILNAATVSVGSLVNQEFNGGGPGSRLAGLFSPLAFSFKATSNISTLTFQVTSSDGFGPVIDNVSVTAVENTYQYNVDAIDPDNDTLTYSLTQAPAGMTIDPGTGIITWQPPSLTDGLLNLYLADGDPFDSVGSSDGLLQGGATYAPGVVGQAFALNGTDAYVQFDQMLVPTSGSYSVSLFERQTGPQSGFVELISQGIPEQFGSGPGFYIGHDPDGIVRVNDSGVTMGVPFPADGEWHHIAATVDPTAQTTTLYIDGILRSTINVAIEPAALGTNTRLGRQFDGSLPEYFNGLIDEVRIYNRALSSLEIQILAGLSPAIPVTIRVTDGRGGSDEQTFTIDLTPATGEIGGAAYNDINGDGDRDTDEPGLPGRIIYLDQNQNGRRDPDERFTTTSDGAPTIVYANDFEDPSRPRPEWSNPRVETSPTGRRFLGQFDNASTTLTLGSLPQHDTLRVEFDLYVINSWDGNGGIGNPGPDLWSFGVVGAQTLLNTTFSANDFVTQSYPDNHHASYPGLAGADARNVLNIPYYDFPGGSDAVYHMAYDIPHSADAIALFFSGSGLQGIVDESWGIDNIVVSVPSNEAAGFYAFTGLAPGVYYVREEQQPGWNLVPAGQTQHLLLNGDFEDTSFTLLPDGNRRYVGWTGRRINFSPGDLTPGYGIFEEGQNGISSHDLAATQLDGAASEAPDPFFPYVDESTPNTDHYSYGRAGSSPETDEYSELVSDPFFIDGPISMDVWRENVGAYSEVRFHDADTDAVLGSFVITAAAQQWTRVVFETSAFTGRRAYVVLHGGTTDPGNGWQTLFDNIFGGKPDVRPALPGHDVFLQAGQTVTGVDFGNHQTGDASNRNPTITSVAPATATTSALYRYNVVATDPDGHTLTFDLPTAPAGMTIHPALGIVVWSPTAAQAGTYPVVIRVIDGHGGTALQSFGITVSLADHAPVITSTPGGPATAGLPYEYRVTAQDADGDPITYSLAAPVIDGMSINAATGLLTWTPTAGQIGSHHVAIIASDGHGGVARQEFDLGVFGTTTNAPPVVTFTPRATAVLGSPWVAIARAHDPNGDPLTFTLLTRPDGMTVDASGRIAWTPTADQLGEQHAQLKVSDGRGGDLIFDFTVAVETQGTNHAPIIISPPRRHALEDETYALDLAGFDEDGDPFTWSLDTAPRGMSIDPSSGQLRWTPADDQLGQHNVVVRIQDLFGASTTQSFTIEVSCINLAPVITSVPPTRAAVGAAYFYAIRAADPESDLLTFALLSPPPAGMTLDPATGLLRWLPSAAFADTSRNIVVQVSDGQGNRATQQFTIEVSATAPNQPPVIISTPVFKATIGRPYAYDVNASDAENGTLTYALSPQGTPPGMTIAPSTGLISWNPVAADAGPHVVTVIVTDPAGAQAIQSFVLLAAANGPPVIQSTAPSTITRGATYRYDVRATDSDGDPLTYALNSGPAGMTLDSSGRLRWNVPHDLSGASPVSVEIAVSDNFGHTTLQTFAITLNTDTVAPTVRLSTSATLVDSLGRYVVDLDGQLLIQVQASDNIGVVARSLTINGVPVPLDSNGTATWRVDQTGIVHVVATATDAAENVGTATLELRVRDPHDVNAPFVEITSPDQALADNIVTYLTNVIGSVHDDNLLLWHLDYALVSEVDLNNLTVPDPDWRQIAGGTVGVTNSLLGVFDPTILQNDQYVIRLYAEDAGGLINTRGVLVSVQGSAKLGNFRLDFTDLQIPLAGFPITITRTYDTLQAGQQGEFGYGWTLGMADAQIRETIPDNGGDFFSQFPFKDGTRVYLTGPDGQRIGFTFQPDLQGSFFGILARPRFVPDPGVYAQLEDPEVSGFALTRTSDGTYHGFMGLGNYNPANYVLTMPDGTKYRYNEDSGLQQATDRNGNQLTFDAAGIHHSGGDEILFVRDGAGRIVEIVDTNGNSLHYAYDSAGNLISFTDQVGNTTRYSYLAAPAHYLDEIRDPLGNRAVKTIYGPDGRVEKIIDALGNETLQSFDPTHFTGTITDAEGHITLLEYNARGNIVRRVDPEGGVTLYEYNDPANLDRETKVTRLGDAGRQVVTTYAYDSRGNTTSVVDTFGTTQYFYDAFSNIVKVIDPLGRVTTSAFDARGNLVTLVNALGDKTTRTYDAEGRATTVADFLGHVTTMIYVAGCSCGIPSEVINPDGTTRHYDGNEFGQIVSATDEEGITVETVYDDSGRVRFERGPQGQQTEYVYDAHLLRRKEVRISATETRVTTYEYFNDGKLKSETDSLGGVIRYTYDRNGNLKTLTDPEDNVTTFVYDGNHRLIEEIDPLGNSRFFEYDLLGNRTAAIDRNGRRRTFDYDDAGRMLHEYWWDAGSIIRTISYAYDAVGNMLTAVDPDSSLVYTYDALNRIVTTDNVGTPGVPRVILTNTYDANGNRISVGDNLGVSVVSTYDDRNRLATREWHGLPDGDAARVEFAYLGNGLQKELRRYSDLAGTQFVGSSEYTYDASGRTDTILHLGPGGQVIASYDYDYDQANQVTRQFYDGPEGDFTATYQYDRTGQLTDVDYLSDEFPDEFYRYDLNGNRTTARVLGELRTYVTTAGNQYATDGKYNYTYDAEGNLRTKIEIATGEVTTYEYDFRNRLIRVVDHSSGGVVLSDSTFQYDSINRRTIVNDNGAVNTTINDGHKVWADFTQQQHIVAHYLFGVGVDQIVARSSLSDSVTWHLTDNLGTVRDVSSNDMPLVAHVDYDTFGNAIIHEGNDPVDRFLFAGREFSASIDAYFNRARYYDPRLGRFVILDPIGFASLDSNLYRYALNAPTIATDPFGTTSLLEASVLAIGTTIAITASPVLGYLAAHHYLNYCEANYNYKFSRGFRFAFEVSVAQAGMFAAAFTTFAAISGAFSASALMLLPTAWKALEHFAFDPMNPGTVNLPTNACFLFVLLDHNGRTLSGEQ